MKIKLILVILTFVFLTLSCSSDNDSGSQPTGTITGKLMVKNGSKPVGGALVFVQDDKSEIFYTYTDADGNFSFKAPVGPGTLQMQTGGGGNFRTSLSINVVKNHTLTIEPTLCRLEQVANMAFVAGTYDSIQDIVTGLGYTIHQIQYNDLTNYAVISQYDVIFLNCGSKEGNSTTIDTNLANFVTNGGSLYASDYSVAYLTGGALFSDICGESGGFIPDDKLCAKNTGEETTITGAQIIYPDLAASLGFSTLDIQYDLGWWEQINSCDSTFWDILVTNPANNQPLMIKTKNFSGGTVGNRVGDDDGWITICHTDDSGTPITITIQQSDWAEHEAHGDSLGSCTNANNSGTIYYTTFHNHASGNIGNSGLILEYVILNL